jgi:hypothetical protein
MNSNNPFGEVVYSYSRKQAIEDGVLVDLTQIETIRRAFKYHVACTDTVWAIIEAATKQSGQDLDGIGHDIATMAILTIRGHRGPCDLVLFKVAIAGRTHTLKLHIGPGDTPEPVMTLMLPNED